MKAEARKYEYAGIMDGDQCFAGMNPPTGRRLPDSECNASCVGSEKTQKEEDPNNENHCGGTKRMSVYRLTIPNIKPNDGARLVKDDVQCRDNMKLQNADDLFKCVQQVRENLAQNGECAKGGGYFNWEAQSPKIGACSCCTNKAYAFQDTEAVNDTNLYKVEHCQNSYKEFLNYCATSENKDTEQVYEEKGNTNIFACQAECNQRPDCTAVEWYSGDGGQ